MKKKLLVALAVIITSGVVFAAAKTTFYTLLDMTNHKITNVGTPTSSSDAATKGYADGNLTKANTNLYAEKSVLTTAINSKLNKSGGTMTGAINMNGQKVTSLGTPTASTDGATKGYVDLGDSTRLPLSGGTMIGNINMSGYRLYGLPSPLGNTDVATKQYVDNSKVNGSCYQYFALRKGSQYLPLCDLPQSDDTNLTVVILREFQGTITSYYENINASSLPNSSFPYKRYKVGETISVPFKMGADTYSKTNGTLVLKGNGGALLGSFIGNFGITAPPNGFTPFTCSIILNGTEYADNTSVQVRASTGWDSGAKSFTFKIKNTSGRTISTAYVSFPSVAYYSTDTTYSYTELDFNAVHYGSLPQSITINGPWANNAEITGVLSVPTFSLTDGLRWQFQISADGSTYTFGQFFMPNVE